MKDAPQSGLAKFRFQRLTACRSILGEPDLLSICEMKSTQSFFGKEKKTYDLKETFISGLAFPTTAHFSSFILSRYQTADNKKLALKVRLFMFDAYEQKDVTVEINIPGSLQVKVFSIRGKALQVSTKDYERAYFSSFLRSLHPVDCPNIVLYYSVYKLEVLRQFISQFVPFSYQNQLRILEDDQPQSDENVQEKNLSIEILISFCMQNKFNRLLQLLLRQIRKHSIIRAYELEIQIKLKLGKHKEVITKTAEKLMLHTQISQLKQFQIKALFLEGKYQQVLAIGKTLIMAGGTDTSTYKLIISSFLHLNEDKSFMKCLNLVSTIHSEDHNKDAHDRPYLIRNTSQINLRQLSGKKLLCISQHPELCFPFDNNFFNRQSSFQPDTEIMKAAEKEGLTSVIIKKVEDSLSCELPFYDALVLYEKIRGWKSLLQFRGECFWLESDFQNYQKNFKKKDEQEIVELFEESIDSEKEQSRRDEQNQSSEERDKNGMSGDIPRDKVVTDSEDKRYENEMEESFDGGLSEHEDQQEPDPLPAVSRRMWTTRLQFNQPKKLDDKILCNGNFEQLFVRLFEDIKLQNSLDGWEKKLGQATLKAFPNWKRELTAMIFLKKGFLHKRLLRHRKCEQSFKMARKLCESVSINLVASYQLILLYIDNNNIKGVEFYLVDLIKRLGSLGIQQYDIVPEWSKPILRFVIDTEGLTILKNINDLFSSIISLYLRSEYSQEQLDGLRDKKDRPKTS